MDTTNNAPLGSLQNPEIVLPDSPSKAKIAKSPINRTGVLVRSKPGAPVVMIKRGGRGGKDTTVQFQHPDAKQGTVDSAIREHDTYMLNHAIMNPRNSGIAYRFAVQQMDNIQAVKGIDAANLLNSPADSKAIDFPRVVSSIKDAIELTAPKEVKQLAAKSGRKTMTTKKAVKGSKTAK